MGEMIAATIGLLLAVYGVADLIARLCWCVVFTGDRPPLTFSVTVGEDAEYRIRRFATWVRLCPGGFTPTVVLNEPNQALLQLCQRLGLICETSLQVADDAV